MGAVRILVLYRESADSKVRTLNLHRAFRFTPYTRSKRPLSFRRHRMKSERSCSGSVWRTNSPLYVTSVAFPRRGRSLRCAGERATRRMLSIFSLWLPCLSVTCLVSEMKTCVAVIFGKRGVGAGTELQGRGGPRRAVWSKESDLHFLPQCL